MPYEDSDINTDEFARLLALIESLVCNNSDCHIITGGAFNVDLSRDWAHTALLNRFCSDTGITPVARHAQCNIDYTYNFNMQYFRFLDHFILSGTLFDDCVNAVSVLHDVDTLQTMTLFY